MTIYFVGDTHFGHGNVIWYCKRPFTDAALVALKADYDKARKTGTVPPVLERAYKVALEQATDQMNEEMIARWNAKVQPEDTVYHVGDVLFCDGAKAERLLSRLNGQIFLVYGNHDKPIKQNAKLRERFVKCSDYLEISIKDPDAPRGVQNIVMSHYAMLVWNKSHHGTWMLHGHSHGGLRYPYDGKILDVGVDPHDLAPISYEEVKRLMSKKKFQPVDHHE
jgi:calcineurin-like phosphoesterase family protein